MCRACREVGTQRELPVPGFQQRDERTETRLHHELGTAHEAVAARRRLLGGSGPEGHRGDDSGAGAEATQDLQSGGFEAAMTAATPILERRVREAELGTPSS